MHTIVTLVNLEIMISLLCDQHGGHHLTLIKWLLRFNTHQSFISPLSGLAVTHSLIHCTKGLDVFLQFSMFPDSLSAETIRNLAEILFWFTSLFHCMCVPMSWS